MAKRKNKKKSTFSGVVLTEEEQALALTKKIERLQELQDRREQSRFIQLLKHAEQRISNAQTQKAQALADIEKANESVKAAEAFLDVAAREVASWENDGVIQQRCLKFVRQDEKVMIAHHSQGLGIVPLDKEDPRWEYGTALSDGSANEPIMVKKSHAAVPDDLETVAYVDPVDHVQTEAETLGQQIQV